MNVQPAADCFGTFFLRFLIWFPLVQFKLSNTYTQQKEEIWKMKLVQKGRTAEVGYDLPKALPAGPREITGKKRMFGSANMGFILKHGQDRNTELLVTRLLCPILCHTSLQKAPVLLPRLNYIWGFGVWSTNIKKLKHVYKLKRTSEFGCFFGLV